ncbi:MAG: hypothetical protein V4560_02725 [Bacteroidota bacterium]
MSINCFGPLNADVWGTVADWVIAITTIFTAIYLIRTFISQKEVQSMQQEITDIEKERYRIEYKPQFDVNFKEINNQQLDGGVRSALFFKLNVIKNEAKDVTLVGISQSAAVNSAGISKGSNGLNMPILNMQPNNEYDLKFSVFSGQVFFDEGSNFSFILSFKDSIGNTYKQSFMIGFRQELQFFEAKNPERIFNTSIKQNWFKRMVVKSIEIFKKSNL